MKVITAPDKIETDLPTIFLGGGITNCAPWQNVIINNLRFYNDAVLLNPRRKNFPINDIDESRKQIEWEFNALTNCDIFTMWFAEGESVQPICMYELGRYVTLKHKNIDRIIIGVDWKYSRQNDVYIQMELIDPNLVKNISNSLDNHSNNIKLAAQKIQKKRESLWYQLKKLIV